MEAILWPELHEKIVVSCERQCVGGAAWALLAACDAKRNPRAAKEDGLASVMFMSMA
jgi:hypothetical protein